ncbi:hypothetical protein ACGFRB_28735 [Streptomyces sp. NPDC048718]|uniref:hypothetical protein n=1 Tax=Streptomyces sp. NPDC048718 TaxID=3365587 RepID=UPI003723A5CD
MSRETGRETDRSSSGAQGRGGAAYPSGTTPYGLRPGQEAAEEPVTASPEEPKTETTLTTRIRINIPGSRPIPPVVVRKTVGDAPAGAAAEDAAGAGPAGAGRPAAPAAVRPEPTPVPEPEPVVPAEPVAQSGAADEKPTSDWFAPRKPSAAAPPKAAAAGEPKPAQEFAPAPGQAGQAGPNAGPQASAPVTGTPGFTGSASDGVPSAASTTQSMPVFTPGMTGGPGHTPAQGTPVVTPEAAAAHMPYDGGPGSTPAAGTPMIGGPEAPMGPTAAVTGSSRVTAAPTGPGAGPARGGGPGGRQGGPGQGGRQGGPAQGGRKGGRQGGPQGGPQAGPHGGPQAGMAQGGMARGGMGQGRPGQGGPGQGGPVQGGPGQAGMGQQHAPRMSDDTAILTPQPPVPVPVGGPLGGGAQRGPGARPALGGESGNVSGATLNSGVPSGPKAPQEPAPRPAPAPAAKKRSKLVLACVGVVGLGAVAYGAGLLLNHSDVPKGTTVLGVDIGGGTKEEAVAKLEATLGKRAHGPVRLKVEGKTVELAPDKAGLSLDAQETVRGAAGSDYNPVSVIGSLFGGERVVQPVMPVDDEKLGVALTDLAGASGSVREATILFEPGKVTPVEGKAGKGLDVQRSMVSVKDAYRTQVATGHANPVELPVVTRRPTVSKAELDKAMKEFAEPAMSGLITIQAGTAKIDFGPQRSLPQILSVKAVDGHLIEVYDKEAITRLLDGVFKGVMVTKGDGSKHEVSADDVAFVMRDALRGKTPAERTRSIDLSGNG